MTKPMYIYLAGPIAGCTEKQAKDWRDYVIQNLPENITGISPLRCEPAINGRYEQVYEKDKLFGTESAISAKNWFDTSRCDLILVYLTKDILGNKWSFGTILEIGWAIAMRKPIILVSDLSDLRNHPLVKRNVDWILDDLDDAVEVITGLFWEYVK